MKEKEGKFLSYNNSYFYHSLQASVELLDSSVSLLWSNLLGFRSASVYIFLFLRLYRQYKLY